MATIPSVFAAPAAQAPADDYPVFVEKIPNPNDYSLFANGGWDGNWYVGYNTCWIKKLPQVPPGDYTRAYLGSRLGRMKVFPNPQNVWDKRPIPGAIYMAIASTTAWSRDRSFLITRTEDIPLEGDSESAVEGTGESDWFWAEVPMNLVNRGGDNFVALWSPTPELISVSSSPVLAAAWGGKEQDTWLLRDIAGVPPRQPRGSPGTAISFFQPAMALKLIPRGSPHPIHVRVVDWKAGTPNHPKPVITARVEGDSVQDVWVEYGSNATWVRAGRAIHRAPFILTVDHTRLPPGRVPLRVAASNIWEERGVSAAFSVDVSTVGGSK